MSPFPPVPCSTPRVQALTLILAPLECGLLAWEIKEVQLWTFPTSKLTIKLAFKGKHRADTASDQIGEIIVFENNLEIHYNVMMELYEFIFL